MKLLKRIVSAGFMFFAALTFSLSVLPSAPTSAQSSAALSIVPRKNYTIEPGKSVKDTLTIRNLDTEKTLDLVMRVVDFTFNDDGGTPKLMLAEDAPQTAWSLKPFLKAPTSVSIPPKSTKTLEMSVSIPANQGAGSYYSAIVYSSGSADGGNVGLSASGVTLVFTTIPGIVNENLVLQKFGAYHDATSTVKGGYAFITTKMPLNIAYTLKNEGNVAEAPVGTITYKHMFGEEQTISKINPNSSLALIGQTRTFTACIKMETENVEFNGGTSKSTACTDPGLWPGMYTAKLDAFYGQNGNNTKEITATAVFWYLPWWFIIASLVVLGIIGYFVWRIVRAIRRRTGHSPYRRAPRYRRR